MEVIYSRAADTLHHAQPDSDQIAIFAGSAGRKLGFRRLLYVDSIPSARHSQVEHAADNTNARAMLAMPDGMDIHYTCQ